MNFTKISGTERQRIKCCHSAVQKYRENLKQYTRMWANAQRNGRPAEYRWRRLFNAAKFGY